MVHKMLSVCIPQTFPLSQQVKDKVFADVEMAVGKVSDKDIHGDWNGRVGT